MFLEGEINWTLVFGVLAVAGHVVALIAIWYAVTHRVRHASASDELNVVQRVAEASEKRLFETLNAIPVALVETDRQGKFVFANRAAHQLLGRRDAELLGLRFHSATWGITFPDGKAVPPDLLPSARALRGQTVRGFQHLLVNASTRRKMLVSVTAMPIENEFGQITGSTAAMVEADALTTPAIEPAPEIVEREPAGPSLSDRVFDAASSALVVVARDGRVLQANRTALAMLGRDPASVIGGDFADLFMPEDQRVEGRQALRAALAAPEGAAEPITARGFDGAPVQWAMLPLGEAPTEADAVLLAGSAAPEPELVPVESPGEDSAALVIPAFAPADVVTPDDPCEREAELIQARDAAEANAAEALCAAETARLEVARLTEETRAELEGARRMETVGRLTGGVAHDFNALLAVMTSALDMLLHQADDPMRVRRLGQAALAAGQRGEVLTRRLTAFAQGDDAAVRTMDVGVLLRGIETRLRALAGPGVDLMIEAPAVAAQAVVDPVAFEGAVRALTQNAMEAVNGQGSVAVRLQVQDETLRLSVRDSGPGMEADVAARALEPFFTTRPGAAGLGLSQAYAFARQSSGVLAIDSAPGEGAEVSITLPRIV